ncbi:MAG TPA: hypothetical protein VLE95_04695, partial [Chlamydiales bacterium]|nr:hypothetical protein [Chlamydiales bacterium]
EAEQALTQTYSYIGRGRQCFAFASEDGKYVVKLPRTDIYKLPLWVRVLPFPSLRNRMRIDRAEREKFIIDSMHIAFEELQEQTAILAIHLGQSASKNKKLTLIDALGCKHLLPLEKTSFVLQYKRPILMKAFQEARRTGDTPQAQRILDALIAAVVDRAEKGILNRDRSFLRNYGFDGHKAYQIDIGSFFRIEGMPKDTAKHKSINDSMDAVKEWLTTNDPEMLPYLNEKLAALSGNSKS